MSASAYGEPDRGHMCSRLWFPEDLRVSSSETPLPLQGGTVHPQHLEAGDGGPSGGWGSARRPVLRADVVHLMLTIPERSAPSGQQERQPEYTGSTDRRARR
jgi:hypothetical protein